MKLQGKEIATMGKKIVELKYKCSDCGNSVAERNYVGNDVFCDHCYSLLPEGIKTKKTPKVLTKDDIEVGVTLYLSSHRGYFNGDAEVISVGSKYFVVQIRNRKISFHIDTLKEKTNLSVDYTLYASEEVYKNKVYHGNLNDAVNRFFSNRGRLSLEKLEAIAKIIDLDTNNLRGE
jgi:DNA-directed RNA polymerase subunit RPC12/RpoP